MKRLFSLALVCLMALSLSCGCGKEAAPITTTPKNLEIQYPPLYREAAAGLFGADMERVAADFGYALSELEQSPFGYLLPDKVSYLGCEFSAYLVPKSTDTGAVLVGIQYYMDLDHRTGSKALEYVGESLQRMYGYPSQADGGFVDFNTRELANILSGKNSWSANLSWVLSKDVSKLAPMEGRTALTLSFRAVHDPAGGASYLILTCDYGPVNENMIRK